MLATVCVREASGAELSGFRVTGGFRVFLDVEACVLAPDARAEVFEEGLDAFAVVRLLLPDDAVPRRSSRSTCPARIVQGGPIPLALPNSL